MPSAGSRRGRSSRSIGATPSEPRRSRPTWSRRWRGRIESSATSNPCAIVCSRMPNSIPCWAGWPTATSCSWVRRRSTSQATTTPADSTRTWACRSAIRSWTPRSIPPPTRSRSHDRRRCRTCTAPVASLRSPCATNDDGGWRVDRFVGLLASTAYRHSTLAIPSVGERARAVLGLARRRCRDAHRPIDAQRARDVAARRRVRARLRSARPARHRGRRPPGTPDRAGHRRARTGRHLVDGARLPAEDPVHAPSFPNGSPSSSVRRTAPRSRDVESFVGTSNLARITFTVERSGDDTPDLDELSDRVDQLTTSWSDRLHDVAARRDWASRRRRPLIGRLGDSVPESYRSSVEPEMAVGDLEHLAELLDSERTLRAALTRSVDAEDGVWRMRVYSRGTQHRAERVAARCSVTSVFGRSTSTRTISGRRRALLRVRHRAPGAVTCRDVDEHRHREVTAAFERLLLGEIEPDGFNRLVLLAGLTSWQVNVLRCYSKFAHQTGFTFSQSYVEDTLARLPHLATVLVELFEARFDPTLDDGERLATFATADDELLRGLDEVPSLDDDRIVRMFRSLIKATVRTSAYLDTPTTRVQVRSVVGARPSRATPGTRDLRVLAAGGRRASAGRPDRTRGSAVERPPRGLSHRGARPRQGTDGEERPDRAGRGQGWVRRQAAEGDRGGEPGRGDRVLSHVRERAARRDRQPGRRRGRPPRTGGPVRRCRPVPGRRRRQGHRDVQRHRQRDLCRVRLLARRRVRVRWQRRLRPQGDGDHCARRLGERPSPCVRARPRRRPRRADRRGRRRHVG